MKTEGTTRFRKCLAAAKQWNEAHAVGREVVVYSAKRNIRPMLTRTISKAFVVRGFWSGVFVAGVIGPVSLLNVSPTVEADRGPQQQEGLR
jgi:hypothetical protein